MTKLRHDNYIDFELFRHYVVSSFRFKVIDLYTKTCYNKQIILIED
jgi:hypothetical protein